jgi:hypothetical protein
LISSRLAAFDAPESMGTASKATARPRTKRLGIGLRINETVVIEVSFVGITRT